MSAHKRPRGRPRAQPATCTAPGCAEGPPIVRGLCRRHYQAAEREAKRSARGGLLRPRVGEHGAPEVLSVRLPTATLAVLEGRAVERGTTPSEEARAAIERGIMEA